MKGALIRMELNRRNIRLVLLIITFTVLLLVAAANLGVVVGVIQTVLQKIAFFTVGVSVAFILDVPLGFFERKTLPLLEKKLGRFYMRLRRPLALFLTGASFVGAIFLVCFMVIPEIIKTFGILEEQLPEFVGNVSAWLTGLMDGSGRSLGALNMPQLDWVKIGDTLLEMVGTFLENFATNTMNAVFSFISGIVTFVVGIVLAFYILYRKEKLASQSKRILYAFLPENVTDQFVRIGNMAREIFGRFISVQFREAFILGMLCFIGMVILGFPFAPMISVLVGIMAIIPIFGAFLSLFIGAFMILVNQGFASAAWFVLFLFILQQVEGNLIYPHVVGKSVKLPGLWILAATTLGGNVAGIPGMLLAVPLASLLYALLRETVNRRNETREIDRDKVEVKDT